MPESQSPRMAPGRRVVTRGFRFDPRAGETWTVKEGDVIEVITAADPRPVVRDILSTAAAVVAPIDESWLIIGSFGQTTAKTSTLELVSRPETLYEVARGMMGAISSAPPMKRAELFAAVRAMALDHGDLLSPGQELDFLEHLGRGDDDEPTQGNDDDRPGNENESGG